MQISLQDLRNYKTLGELILGAIERYPAHTAFIDPHGASVSYQALGHKIQHLLHVLRELGLKPGDSVAQLCGNRVEMFSLMAAAYIGGYKSVTLHAMAGVDDHAAILADCDAKVLVYEHYFAGRAAELKTRCMNAPKWLSQDAQDEDACIWSWDAPPHYPALQAMGSAEDIARLAYTGGTTGRSKGVMLSNRALLANTRLWLSGIAWPDQVHTLCSAPISHGAGSLIYPTLVVGGTVYLQRGFTAESWLRCVEENQIQHTFIVPTMLYALLDHPSFKDYDLGSLTALMYGASPASPARIRQALERFGPVLVQTYGQTEAPNTILLLDQQAHKAASDQQLASAGVPFPSVDVTLRGEDDQPVKAGETGEICVTGALIMSGYHGQAEQTAQALKNGFLHTGDLGRLGDDGLIYLVDRKKDMIISGGFNVYPKEVEDVLSAHPDVAAVAVFGIPDEKWGEAVKAVVALKAGATTSADALIEFVRGKKGAICTPKSIDLVDTVPVTSLGKPDKKSLRSHYWTNHTREIS